VLSIDNISTDGLLISFTGSLEPFKQLSLSFIIPNGSKQVSLSGYVVYVIENSFQHKSIAGIRLTNTKHIDEARIRNFIMTCHSTSAFKDLYDHLMHGGVNDEFQIDSPDKIIDLMNRLLIEKLPINVLSTRSLRIYELEIAGISEDSRTIELSNMGNNDTLSFGDCPTTYISFLLHGGSYFFKTERILESTNGIVVKLPDHIFHSEKRSYQRKYIELSSDVHLWINNGYSLKYPLHGSLVDISRRGFMCKVTVPYKYEQTIKPGTIIEYQVDDSLGLGEQGEIRHIKEISADKNGKALYVGIEAGIRRCNFKFQKLNPVEPCKQNRSKRDFPDSERFRIQSIPVAYTNSRNQEIKALVNATGLGKKAPVVVIPPAFGKKKETLSPFVTTLLYNFTSRQKDITVLRYDGINRPGESYNENKIRKRGYEMLCYQISQGLDDLAASLEFVFDNPYFESNEVILLTFSMSAIDARRFLSSYRSKKYHIKQWISCMGVACAQTTIGNILAGIDIVSNHKMGIPNGIHGMLGHILDMDRVAKDLVEKKYAYMTDARQDMAKIGIPILWIYGEHDKWVGADEVRDIMSVDAQASREVIELASGHNLRTSDDAIYTFRLITNSIYEKLFGEQIESVNPPKSEILRILSYERERLENAETFDTRDYWHDYLIGDCQQSSGYDFYRELKEFRGFLRREIELLQLENGNRIADMGCGTGLLLEDLLRKYTTNGYGNFKLDIEAIELVPEALEKTRRKCESILQANSKRDNVTIHYNLTDLEPNRLIPVGMFVNNTELDFNFLRNKIIGLRNTLIDKLQSVESPELYRIMRGAKLSDSRIDFISSIGDQDLIDTIFEFNRAARFIGRELNADDFINIGWMNKDVLPSHIDYELLSTKALKFEILEFGDSGINFNIAFATESFDRIVASLLLSYLVNGDYLLYEFNRILKPGGLLLISSMKPDSDLSTIFMNYIKDVESMAKKSLEYGEMHSNFAQARSMLNEAANLCELEEDGYFHFYSAEELAQLLTEYGFENVTLTPSLGDPAQAIIVTGTKPISE
jgi:ubiquinone/menaquinone biosynthesis C-methylase UbiE